VFFFLVWLHLVLCAVGLLVEVFVFFVFFLIFGWFFFFGLGVLVYFSFASGPSVCP